MNIFNKLFKSKPIENRLSTTPTFYSATSDAGVKVTAQSAMRSAAVYACVRVISEAISTLPLKIYKRLEVSVQEDYTHPLYDILHLQPNDDMTSLDFRETLTCHLLLHGNAYAQIIRNGHNQITELHPLLPNKMDIHRDENGQLFYEYKLDNNKKVILQKREILHIHGLAYDGLVGYSPIDLARNAIGMSVATERFGSNFFANGAFPGGVLEVDADTTINPEGQKNLRESWQGLYKGKGAHRVAVLECGMKYKQIGIPPDQAQFLETRRFQIGEIARIFKVPPHMIGDLEKSTFSNIEHQSLDFVKMTLTPWLERFEQSMNIKLLSPQERKTHIIKFNLDGILRGDRNSRTESYKVGRQNGWYSANDIRKLENMPPLPSEIGDVYLVNGNMISIQDAASGVDYRRSQQEQNQQKQEDFNADE